MKKLLIVMAAIAAASTSFAGKLNLDARVDSDSATYNTDAGLPGYQKYYLQTGRIDWNGTANEDLSYRVRLRFNKTQGAVNTRDSLNDTVDMAYFANKMSDLTLTLGKFEIDTAGFEGATTGADLYFTSQAYNDTTVSNTRYATGLKGTYNFGDHTLALGHTNPRSDETQGSSFAQSNSVAFLVYKGALLEKSLKLNASYHQSHKAYDKDATNSQMNLGVKYEQAAWFASLDLNMHAAKNYTTADKTDTLSSYVLNGGYNINDSMAVKAKYEMSNKLVNTNATTETKTAYTGMGLAFECKPVADTNFRYHVAYTSLGSKVDGATASPNESHVVLGARLLADFLK